MSATHRGAVHCPYCGYRASISSADRRGPAQASRDAPAQPGYFTLDDDMPPPGLVQKRRAAGRSGLWAFGVVLLLLSGAGQLLWFQRDTLLVHYPELRPQLIALCERLHCQVNRQYRLDAIRLLTRELRADEKYPDRLLLSAILENTLSRHQAWPILQLVLSDHTGQIISAGEFLPGDYLGPHSPFTVSGMPPRQPVYFTMTVQGQQSLEQASGYEFHLLPCNRMRSCRRGSFFPPG